MKFIYSSFPIFKKSNLRIVITTHYRPDADALGSSLGLQKVLQLLGHEVSVITPNRCPSYLHWMPKIKSIVVFEEQTEKAKTLIEQSDWIFALDYNSFHRTNKMQEILFRATQPKVLIDHHHQPDTKFFDYGISDTSKSSTSEMIYDFIVNSGLKEKIDIETMELLYAGIIGDTGSFAFASTTANALSIASFFKQQGLATHHVYERLFQSNSLTKIQFTGFAISNLMQVFEKQHTALIPVSLVTYKSYNLQSGDIEGLVNLPLSIRGINFSALVLETAPDECKWSFRSLGKMNVNNFARTYFNGGGHLNAAGGVFDKDVESSVKFFKNVLLKTKV